MNRIIITIIALVMLTTQIQAKSNFKIYKMTETEIILDFELQDYELKEVEKNQNKYQMIKCESDGQLSIEGNPLIPFYSEIIGLPINGDFQINVLSKKMATVKNILLLPADKLELINEKDEQNKQVITKFYKNDKFYSRDQIYPDVMVKKNEAAYLGNRYFAGFQFYPFRYNPQKKVLEVIQTARLQIMISGNIRSTPKNKFNGNISDSYGDSFFLNNIYSKNWRKEKEPRVQNYRSPKNPTQVNELYLKVIDEGIYKVTYQDLQDSLAYIRDSLDTQLSFDLNTLDPRYLELRDKNGPVPINFVGENDGVFNSGDYFEFYGEVNKGENCYYDNYSNENIYILSLKTDNYGTRMAVENGGLQLNNPSPNLIVPDSYEQTVHFENQVFTDRLGNQISQGEGAWYNREDLLFWKSITAPDLNITYFNLEYPRSVNTRYFTAKISLFGSSYSDNISADHHAIVRVNSALINNKWWTRQREQIFENPEGMANSYLNHGTNSLYIDLPGDTHSGNLEQIFLDYFELTYWREYKTSKNEIKFNKPSNKGFGFYQFDIQDFTEENISVYKIGSSVFNNLTIRPLTDNELPPFTLSFQDQISSEGIEYYAVSESNKKHIHGIRPNYSSDLKNPDNTATNIIITKKDFVNDPGTLLFKQIWESEGQTVKIVDIQDIYDEFGHSIPHPQSIKDFISYAYNQWQEPKLTHVLLLGDGLFDKRNQADTKKYDIIPVKNIWTYKHGATSSDNWYACIVGQDPVADINISRICVYDKSQILPIAQKSLQYSTQPNFSNKWHSQIILATGGKVDDLTDTFAQQSERIRKDIIPQKYHVNRVYTAVKTVSSEYVGGTFKLKDYINDGAIFLQFMGHGGGRIWADYNLLNVSDIHTLSNANYPIVSSLACFASAFDTKGLVSIGEALVSEPNKGAIGHIGFSGLGYLNDDLYFGMNLSDGMFNQNLNTIGDVISYTKAKFYGKYPNSYAGIALTQGCVYIGDPMVHPLKPNEDGQISFLNDTNVHGAGDTLRFKVRFDPSINLTRMLILNQNEIPQNISMIENPVINGEFNSTYVIPNYTGQAFTRTIKFIGSSSNGEYITSRYFSLGQPLASDIRVIPSEPTINDTVDIRVKFFQTMPIQSVYCRILVDGINFQNNKQGVQTDPYNQNLNATIKLPMRYDLDLDYWVLDQKLSGFKSLGIVHYYFEIQYQNGAIQNTNYSLNRFEIHGPDLSISFVEYVEHNNLPSIRLLTQNIGNTASSLTSVACYNVINGIQYLINRVEFAGLEAMEKRWDYIPLKQLKGSVLLKIIVNEQGIDFLEGDLNNNISNYNGSFNLQEVNSLSSIINSLDNNVKIEIPAQMFNQSTYINLVTYSKVNIDNQADIKEIKLKNGNTSNWYEINCLNKSLLADSLGRFPNNKKIIITFNYSSSDSLTQYLENQERFHIYRWEPKYKKMIYQGGILSSGSDFVVGEIDREGIYTVFYNNDRILPNIDINVEGQEFTEGGYISGTGVFSFLFQDANGIDLIDHPITLFLDGQSIDSKEFAISIIPEHINHIPMKYRLNLVKGEYILNISCTDVNGNNNSKQVSFRVNDQFSLTKIANYPNPVKSKTIDPVNANRTRFTYTLTDDADHVKIKIYTVSGRLVKTFDDLPKSVGYHEYPRTVYGWDCRDNDNYPLANGVYFYKVIAKRGNKEIIKTAKMAILR